MFCRDMKPHYHNMLMGLDDQPVLMDICMELYGARSGHHLKPARGSCTTGMSAELLYNMFFYKVIYSSVSYFSNHSISWFPIALVRGHAQLMPIFGSEHSVLFL